MIKVELEKEARQKALEWNHKKINGKYNRPPIANWSCYEKGYLAGAEPREKQIQIDAEQIRALQKQNGELTDKVKELEQKLIEADNATDVFNAQEKRIAKLESQNKELKKWLKEKFESCANENLSFVAKYDTACQELDSCKTKIAELETQIEKMKRCEICKHYQCGSCNYHSNWVKDCKENGMKLFELKEIKE